MNKKMQTTLRNMYRYKMIYIMLIPVALYFLMFSYYPLLLGIVLSFQKSKMFPPPEFVGAANYTEVFSNPMYIGAFSNTLVVGIGSFAVQFLFGLTLALAINEVGSKIIKSGVQSTTYLPNLLSWSIVGGMWVKILSANGMVNGFVQLFAGESYKPVIFMAEANYAQLIMILTNAWKGAGYTAVLLLAAIVAIDPSLYEAASIDGASRFKQITKIIIPNLVNTMKTIIVLGSMGILRNFDQIYVMQNSSIIGKVRNLLYLIYTDGVTNLKVGQATAAATMVLIATFLISVIVRALVKYDQSYE